jgi:predicted amidophosphoribosyltransferase
VSSYEPDWDAGTENAYEAHRAHIESLGLCDRCKENAVLPEQDFCEACALELKLAFTESGASSRPSPTAGDVPEHPEEVAA